MANPNSSNTLLTVVVSIVILGFAAYPFFSSESNKSVTSKGTSSKIIEVKYKNEFLPDFSTYRDVKEKKRAFFGYLKPLVIQVNKEVKLQREFVLSLTKRPSEKDAKANLAKLKKRYDVDPELGFDEARTMLLRRIDTLPVALVLMQAANESAWGTSRFALQANNLFGQWCFRKGCGVIPKGRPDGETYEVRKFHHPIDSIRSYFHNLNSGHAYKELRTVREQLRRENDKLDATELATGLTKYSIRREAYVEEIQNMIRINQKYL